MRIAHGHGLKVQTFCNLIFGSRYQVWNRDIDRLGPDWLLDTLAECTGTPRDVAFRTTLRSYEGQLFRRFRSAGTLQWIQTLMMYHRKRQGFGMQLCPACLREGDQPYYRRLWRVSFYTICSRHACMMLDRCPECGAGISFHRTDVGNYQMQELSGVLVRCHCCGIDLSQVTAPPAMIYDAQSIAFHVALCGDLAIGQSPDIGLMDVMHHLSTLLIRSSRKLQLQAYASEFMNVRTTQTPKKRVTIESHPLDDRHHFMLLIAWLMQDLEGNLTRARQAKALRYLHLRRDFPEPPTWYLDIADRFQRKKRTTPQLT